MNNVLEYFPPPSGPLASLTRSIAVLRHEPAQLARRAPLRFREAHDDLDVLHWAEVVGASGRRYALVRHRRSPTRGTAIVTAYDSRHPEADIQEVLRGLSLSHEDLVWTAPDVRRLSGTSRRSRRNIGRGSPSTGSVAGSSLVRPRRASSTASLSRRSGTAGVRTSVARISGKAKAAAKKR